MMVGLLLLLQVATLSAQNPANTVYDRVILGGHVMDPVSKLDADRNIGLSAGRMAVITTPPSKPSQNPREDSGSTPRA